ncbi:hypothetical protein L7F22_025198 [Adiantum nelumboides]|nr:hypothetical protein [Adiantum nelumboides]
MSAVLALPQVKDFLKTLAKGKEKGQEQRKEHDVNAHAVTEEEKPSKKPWDEDIPELSSPSYSPPTSFFYSSHSSSSSNPRRRRLTSILMNGKSSSKSPIDYEDVPAYRMSLTEDTKSINLLNLLVQEGKEMVAVLYTYRSCVKALPQLPDSMKQSQSELYLETYQVLDLEISRLRSIQQWQASAASKLAVDMQRFSRPERRLRFSAKAVPSDLYFSHLSNLRFLAKAVPSDLRFSHPSGLLFSAKAVSLDLRFSHPSDLRFSAKAVPSDFCFSHPFRSAFSAAETLRAAFFSQSSTIRSAFFLSLRSAFFSQSSTIRSAFFSSRAAPSDLCFLAKAVRSNLHFSHPLISARAVSSDLRFQQQEQPSDLRFLIVSYLRFSARAVPSDLRFQQQEKPLDLRFSHPLRSAFSARTAVPSWLRFTAKHPPLKAAFFKQIPLLMVAFFSQASPSSWLRFSSKSSSSWLRLLAKSILKLLDMLLQLDHLKNAKASIPNDFSWYKRTFTQVSTQWQDTDSMREELDDLQIFLSTRWAILSIIQGELFRVNNVEDILQVLIHFCVESLESDSVLLYSERHVLLRVLPVLVVLAMSTEKDGDAIFKKIKVARLINIFKKDPVVPAFPDLHLAPASMLKELSAYFQKFSAQSRLVSLPSPHELAPREAAEYPFNKFLLLVLSFESLLRHYCIVNQMAAIRLEHDEFVLRFAAATNQLQLLKLATVVDDVVSKEIKDCMFNNIVEGFQLLNKWTGRVWEQCAWKFSRPCKDTSPFDGEQSTVVSDYEKVVRCNYTQEERKAMVELLSYIKGVGSMMEKVDTLVSDSVWESIHGQVQEFVQNKLSVIQKTSFRKRKDLVRLITDMQTIAADFMGNATKLDFDLKSSRRHSENNSVFFHPRPVAPTAAQLHCLQFLIHELVSGSAPRKAAGFFGSNDPEVPQQDLRQLESFFSRLAFLPHILDYKATLAHVTDLGFLWFREFYLETSRVIQFPIECSLPWMLVDHVIESQDTGLLESVLMPFDVYNDSAEFALHGLKQRFLYDEIEAEVDLCFDQLVFKLTEHIFSHYKSFAASKMLDSMFLATSENSERFIVPPKRYDALFRMRRVKLLGRSVDLAYLIGQRMNKIFRENLDYLLERFESHDICSVVELQQLIDVLRLTHHFVANFLTLDPFKMMLEEMTETISLISFSGRLASQVFAELQNDVLPNFCLCNTTQRLIRSPKNCQRQISRPSAPHVKSSFLCGTHDLNIAYAALSQLYSRFFGLPHFFAIAKLLGSSLPWLIRAVLDLLSQKIMALEPKIAELRGELPKAIHIPSYDGGVAGCLTSFQEQLQWAINFEGRAEVLQTLKEMGSLIFFLSLLDTAIQELETEQFIQDAPFLGYVPGGEMQMDRVFAKEQKGPIVNICRHATNAILMHPGCLDTSSFLTLCKQAEIAESLALKRAECGSILEYALDFLSKTLDTVRSKWNATSKVGLMEITSSKEFHRIYSGIQFVFCGGPIEDPISNQERFGDAVAWGGCAIIYLLEQHLRFELLDFVYHALNVTEVEIVSTLQATLADKIKQISPSYAPDLETFIENGKKVRRLNSHVFSMLKACFPLEEKQACMIKQSGTLVPRIKYPNTPSAFETLPLKDGPAVQRQAA